MQKAKEDFAEAKSYFYFMLSLCAPLICVALACPPTVPPMSPTGLARMQVLQEAIRAHRDQEATQEVVVHFKDSELYLHSVSRVIAIDGSVITLEQSPTEGQAQKLFSYLPNILTDPLHRLPLVSGTSEEVVGQVSYRVLRPETINGVRYEVVEVIQHPIKSDMLEGVDTGYEVTRFACKLYLGKEGLVERKVGTLTCQEPVEEKQKKKKPRSFSVPFESVSITYRKATR